MIEAITKAMRGMAWERIKGDLNSLSQADYPPQNATGNKPFLEWESKCNKRHGKERAGRETLTVRRAATRTELNTLNGRHVALTGQLYINQGNTDEKH